MTTTSAEPRYAVGDLIGIDTPEHRYRVFKVLEVDKGRGRYLTERIPGGQKVSAAFGLAYPEDEEPPSQRQLAPGTLVRYIGTKTNLAIKPGEFGVVAADKHHTRSGEMVANVWPLGGGDGISYVRASHVNLEVVPVTGELLAAIEAISHAG
jgi:hypothetical protein